jgi:hypothetical protein
MLNFSSINNHKPPLIDEITGITSTRSALASN